MYWSNPRAGFPDNVLISTTLDDCTIPGLPFDSLLICEIIPCTWSFVTLSPIVAAALRMSLAHADALLELVPPTRSKPRLPRKNMLVILLIALFATGANGFPILPPNG